PTCSPLRALNSEVPMVAPFHQVKVFARIPITRALLFIGARMQADACAYHETKSPGLSPSCADRPAFSSSTALVGPADGTGSSEKGVVLAAILRSEEHTSEL